jgi:hypothetical protein
MSEIRRDLGYDIPPNRETNRKIRQYLHPETKPDPRHPDEDWQIDDDTKVAGIKGVADVRAVLEVKRKQREGEALTPEDERLLAELHRQEHPE